MHAVETNRYRALIAAYLRPQSRKVVLLGKDGRVEAEGQLDELLESSAEMQRLWRGELSQDNGSDG